MLTPSEIAPIVQDCFNQRNSARLLELWADDFHFEAPNASFKGKEQMLKQEENLWTAFPDIRSEVQTFLAGNDRVTLQTRMFGTHTGPLRLGNNTVAATGNKVEFTLAVHMLFCDGRIAGERVFYDTAGLLRQLGLLK